MKKISRQAAFRLWHSYCSLLFTKWTVEEASGSERLKTVLLDKH